LNKDTRKWCEYHKIPWHNNEEWHSKKSLVVKMKASKSEENFESESNPEGGKHIIYAKPNSMVTTTKFQPGEPEEPEEGEHIFHSHMWVKGDLLHFIVDRGSQKNLISIDVIKIYTYRRQCNYIPTPLVGFAKEEISASANSVICSMA
jgi:hypothetical protein